MVNGWTVDKEGNVQSTCLVSTESPRIFIRYDYSSGLNLLAGVGIPIYSPSTPHKHYLLNEDFFLVRLDALKQAEENISQEVKRLQQKKADVLGEIVSIMDDGGSDG